MSASKTEARLLFKAGKAREIGKRHGVTQDVDLAAFFNVTQSNWSRVVNDEHAPGRDFMVNVLSAGDKDAEISFDSLFQVSS